MAENRIELGDANRLASWRMRLAQVEPSLWLAPMLLSLHTSILLESDLPLAARLLMSLHVCLFALWQPVLGRDTPLNPRLATVVLTLGVALVLLDSPWAVTVWLTVLSGMAATGLAAAGRRRWQGLLSLAYPPALLFGWSLPQAAGVALPAVPEMLVLYGLPLLPLAALQGAGPTRQATLLDCLYGVFTTLVLLMLGLAVFVVMHATGAGYAWSLALGLVGLAGFLFLIGWLWNPPAGGNGLGLLASRYLLAVGMPFETFARRLAELAERTHDPHTLVADAVGELRTLTWVRGACWRIDGESHCAGETTGPAYEFAFHGLHIVWYADHALPAALSLHLRLASQLVGHFQAAKAREQALQEHAYREAIAETGARVAHDMKNTLQSMSALIAAVDSAPEGEGGRLGSLLRRQLPHLSARLTRTLDHLRRPEESVSERVAAADWWQALQARYAGEALQFDVDGKQEVFGEVPCALFDSVADNLLLNALRKRRAQPGLHIVVRMQADGTGFEVVDDGAAVPDGVASRLFASEVSGEGGLGVGLYLAARQAQRAGHRLALIENVPGRVRFVLNVDPDAVRAAA